MSSQKKLLSSSRVVALPHLLTAELYGCHAEVFLDVFAKERRIGKAQLMAHLLDAHIGLSQVVANVLKQVFGDPFTGCLARIILAHHGEVLRRDAEFVGIGMHRAVTAGPAVQQLQETLEETVAACNLAAAHHHLHRAANVEERRAQQRVDHIGPIGMVVGVVDADVQHTIEQAHKLYVLGADGRHVHTVDIEHLCPNTHFFAQEAVQDAISKENGLKLEVGA